MINNFIGTILLAVSLSLAAQLTLKWMNSARTPPVIVVKEIPMAGVTGASDKKGQIKSTTHVASLWSGYGSIDRITYVDGSTAIEKVVSAPPATADSSESHRRKLRSYEIERSFYKHIQRMQRSSHNESSSTTTKASTTVTTTLPRMPQVYLVEGESLVMEDLDVNFPVAASDSMNIETAKLVLSWLAHFHATFWGVSPAEDTMIWEQGAYWHLDTRREEWERLDPEWKRIADAVDAKLKQAIAEGAVGVTWVHGDVKSENVVLDRARKQCALYDFQYVGKGLGVLDVAYFLSTSVEGIEKFETELLRWYHSELVKALGDVKGKTYTFDVMVGQYELCLIDWLRFMKGWGKWGNARYVERRVCEILARKGWL